MRRNGIRTSIIAILHYCALAFTRKVLATLFEFQSEVKQFLLKENKHKLYKHFEDDHWIAKLAYMADVFEHMNELNIKTQRISENMLTFSDKLHGFQ